MIRFTMPSKCLSKEEKIKELDSQFTAFLTSPALLGIIEILKDSTKVNPKYIKNFFDSFDTRKIDGKESIERQCIKTPDELKELFEINRSKLYKCFFDLGLININKPLLTTPNHLLVLGASFNACYNRCLGAERIIRNNSIDATNLEYVSALGAYRIINPTEKKNSAFLSSCETEFGALSDSFIEIFGLTMYKDDFSGTLNTNKISCIRTFDTKNNIIYRIYAAPSSEPNKRRANSIDTYNQYILHNKLQDDDNCLLVTNNVYCNYQFIPFALELLKNDLDVNFDIIGCSDDTEITKENEFDPNAYLQVVISIIDWIYIFKKSFKLKGLYTSWWEPFLRWWTSLIG